MNDNGFYDPERQTLDELQLEDDLEANGIDDDIASVMVWMLKDF